MSPTGHGQAGSPIARQQCWTGGGATGGTAAPGSTQRTQPGTSIANNRVSALAHEVKETELAAAGIEGHVPTVDHRATRRPPESPGTLNAMCCQRFLNLDPSGDSES